MKVILLVFTFFISVATEAQTSLERFSNLVGVWDGSGEGFGNSKSKITAEYTWLMNKQYIEMKHHSEFEPTEENAEGEVHEDLGILSFDKDRNVAVFRQFHNEGYFTEYILNDSISSPEVLVFETTHIENFVPGGKARFTIKTLSDSEIETVFDVGFPGKDMACFGTNRMKKK